MRRRTFLSRLGLGTAACFSPLAIRSSWADGNEPPKRLLILSHNHGWTYETWKMRPAGLDSTQRWDVDLNGLEVTDFSGPLAPLYSHRQRMIAIDGLSLATAELDMDGFRHETGWVQAWTGNWGAFNGSAFLSQTGLGAMSASLDQIVAAHVARPDRLPSIEIDLNYGGPERGRSICFEQNGRPLPLIGSPQLLWNRLFGPSLDPDPLISRRGKVLDFAHQEFSSIRSQLGTAEQQKIDSHFDLMERLSQRLQGMADISCDNTSFPADTIASYDESFDAFSELIAAAFACDVTRVATISMGDIPTSDFGWGDFTDDVHKGLAHEIYNSADCHAAMTDYITHHARQVDRLVSLLESIPDVDGRSVMDNTLIVWGSELANGWHGYQQYCPTIIGGSWHFNTGRYVHIPHETPINILVPSSIETSGYSAVSGLPHQHLLVSVAQAMGVETETVGLSHVQSQNGDWVDCSGPLPELT